MMDCNLLHQVQWTELRQHLWITSQLMSDNNSSVTAELRPCTGMLGSSLLPSCCLTAFCLTLVFIPNLHPSTTTSAVAPQLHGRSQIVWDHLPSTVIVEYLCTKWPAYRAPLYKLLNLKLKIKIKILLPDKIGGNGLATGLILEFAYRALAYEPLENYT